MIGPIEGPPGGYITREDFSKPDEFGVLMGLDPRAVPRKKVVGGKTNKTDEFGLDLKLAGRAAVDCVKGVVATARGRERLFAALKGASSNEWSRDDQVTMLSVLSPFLDGAEIGFRDFSDVADVPEYLPAFPGPIDYPDGATSQLHAGYSCAIDLDGKSIFVSTGLGLRDMLRVSQVATAQALIQRFENAQIDIDASGALSRVCDVLGDDPGELLGDDTFRETTVLDRGVWKPAVGIAAV